MKGKKNHLQARQNLYRIRAIILSNVQLMFYSHRLNIHKYNQLQNKIFHPHSPKIPYSSKKSKLTFLCTRNFSHSIYIVFTYSSRLLIVVV